MYHPHIFLPNFWKKYKCTSMGNIVTVAFCVCWHTTTFSGRLQFEETVVGAHDGDGGFLDTTALPTNFHIHILLLPWLPDMCGTRAVQWRKVAGKVSGGLAVSCTSHPNVPNDLLQPMYCLNPKQQLQAIFSWVWLHPCLFPGEVLQR